MTIRNLDKLFNPKSVAVIGASRRPEAVGHLVLRNLLTSGFDGPVMAVNPKAESILSTIAYPDVAHLPMAPDLAVLTTPPQTVPNAIAELGAKGTKAAIVITAGFGEGGAEGKALQAEMLAAAKPHTLRIIGPNCLGVMVPPVGLNAGFAHLNPKPGGLALIAQSGAIITSVIDWADARGIGFSNLVSMGGMADVDFGDMLDYLAHDPQTRAILLYVESVTNPRKFMSAARAASRLKPVIVIKTGRTAAAAKAASSHTGALAGSDAVYHAAFRRAGMIRVLSIDELFDAAETLTRLPKLKGDRLAILTNGGGIGVMATDALITEGGALAELQPQTIEALNACLPPTWSHANPIDIIGDADGARYTAALKAVLTDDQVDALLVLNCPTAISDSLEVAEAVADATSNATVPVMTSWLGETSAEKARDHFAETGLATYGTPEQAISAFMHLSRHRRNQSLLMEVPGPAPQLSDDAKGRIHMIVSKVADAGRNWLTEVEAKEVLIAAGIETVPTRIAKDAEECVALATELGGPVALKIHSPDITHKTDAGGVKLGLTADTIGAAAEAMTASVLAYNPDARLEGFTVQPMAHRPGAHELILGLATDSLFGPVILFGQGGTAVEIIKDQALSLLPLNDVLANDLIDRTQVSKLLAGYRGRPPVDRAAIVAALQRLSELAVAEPRIKELDINPLWADKDGVLALDARIRIDANPQHFAIRPYPEELEKTIEDRAGHEFLLRPIRPDDEPALERMIAGCSREDIRMRFFSALKELPKALAARLTQIDYDREMCFVAVREDGELVGSVRLLSDPNGEAAEYSVLVRSDLKGAGIGFRLMNEIIAYGRSIGLKQIFGEVRSDNEPMLKMTVELGFETKPEMDDPTICHVTLTL